MALHAPSHHVPTPHIGAGGRQYLRDLALAFGLALAIMLVFGAGALLRPVLPQFGVTTPEAQSLVEFRAGERASLAAGQTSEGQSILLFRESERAGR